MEKKIKYLPPTYHTSNFISTPKSFLKWKEEKKINKIHIAIAELDCTIEDMCLVSFEYGTVEYTLVDWILWWTVQCTKKNSFGWFFAI